MNIIAENIARRRKELGMTQKELAEKLNISDKTLSRWETDKQVPDAMMIPKIAKVLDMTIHEIYGVEEDAGDVTIKYKVQEELDEGGMIAYKILLLSGIGLFVLGSGIYGFMGIVWNYMKFGAIVLVFAGLALFLTGEMSFEEFYQKKDCADIYRRIHTQWYGLTILIAGLLVGIVIPAVKAPPTTLLNNWDAILPLVLFQAMIYFFYIRRKKQEETSRNVENILAVIGTLCILGFLFNALKNPYRYLGGFTYQDWEIDALWGKIKFFEMASGVVFFLMNVYMLKETFGIYGKALKKSGKIAGIGLVIISLIAIGYVYISNKNLQSRVEYTAGEVPMNQINNYSHELIEWIQECNLSGEEICMKKSMVSCSVGETVDAYLIYLPHGSAETELEIDYRFGWGENALQIKAENTTQILDDTYYFCYVEILNNGEEYDFQTYLDGERITHTLESVSSVWNVFEE